MYWKIKSRFLLIIRSLSFSKNKHHARVADFFDASWYLAHNSDLVDKDINVFNHYCNHGWREGRRPNPIFDPQWYVKNNADVAQANIEPLQHFVRHGRFEGRRPSAAFDPATYLRLNPGIAESKLEPCEHYLRYGRSKGLRTIETEESRIAALNTSHSHIEDKLDFSGAILAMRDAMAPSNRSFPQETVMEAVKVLIRLDGAGSDWRSRFLEKTLYQLDEDNRPVPDGLSYDYIKLADSLNDGGLTSSMQTYDERIARVGIDPIAAAEALMQRELGEAIKLEAQLLHRRCTYPRG